MPNNNIGNTMEMANDLGLKKSFPLANHAASPIFTQLVVVTPVDKKSKMAVFHAANGRRSHSALPAT